MVQLIWYDLSLAIIIKAGFRVGLLPWLFLDEAAPCNFVIRVWRHFLGHLDAFAPLLALVGLAACVEQVIVEMCVFKSVLLLVTFQHLGYQFGFARSLHV